MISCPNCNHENPDGAVQCEACYTPLPQATTCPQCGAMVQSNAAFCGQCGFNLKAAATVTPSLSNDIPATIVPSPPDPEANQPTQAIALPDLPENTPINNPTIALETAVQAPPPAAGTTGQATQLQMSVASLLHVQTNIPLELPSNLTVIHIGKPNDIVPPDIDVSGFPNSEVVSRVHADIRVEEGLYYIEDTGSSNGTYINHVPLPVGNRHRLRAGDRIALGKGDKVTFMFQLTSG